jgi:hypothetical protein
MDRAVTPHLPKEPYSKGLKPMMLSYKITCLRYALSH